MLLAPTPEQRGPRIASVGAGAFAEWSWDVCEPCWLPALRPTGSWRRARGGKLPDGAALAGLAREALEIGRVMRTASGSSSAVRSARFQGVAHPLADSASEIEGARLLVWKIVWASRNGAPMPGRSSRSDSPGRRRLRHARSRALHVHGGLRTVALDCDIQLYHSRVKAWPLAGGDPKDQLRIASQRLWGGSSEVVSLPDAGEVAIDFGLGAEAEAFAAEARQFFAQNLTRRAARAPLRLGVVPIRVSARAARANTSCIRRGHASTADRAAVATKWRRSTQVSGGPAGAARDRRDRPRRAHVDGVRQRKAQERGVDADRARRCDLLPRLHRARVRLGRRIRANTCRPQRRRMVIDGQKMFTSGANIRPVRFC